MKLAQLIEFLRNRLKAVTLVCLAVLALLALADILFVDKEHAHTWAEKHVPAFWSVFGFIGCVLIIIFSKWFGHAGIMTREEYYEDGRSEASEERSHE